MKKLLSSCLLIVLCLSASSQASDSLKAQLIRDWERAKAYTKEYLDAMPKDKYDYRAHDSVRSFAQQMLHLAQGTVFLGSNGTGKQRLWQGVQLERSKTAQSADSVMYYVMASYDWAIDGVKNMDMNQLWEVTGQGNFKFTRYAWITKAFEHQTHHRGQATIYIRLLGIKPPQEKLF
jgi:uncharacterized damage-inducible protein DinB